MKEMKQTERLLELAQELTENRPRFFEIKGPGAGERATNSGCCEITKSQLRYTRFARVLPDKSIQRQQFLIWMWGRAPGTLPAVSGQVEAPSRAGSEQSAWYLGPKDNCSGLQPACCAAGRVAIAAGAPDARTAHRSGQPVLAWLFAKGRRIARRPRALQGRTQHAGS